MFTVDTGGFTDNDAALRAGLAPDAIMPFGQPLPALPASAGGAMPARSTT